MPNNLTASALVAIQDRLERVYGTDTPTQYPYNEPGFTTGALMERQSATLSPHLNSGGQVIGYEAHYLVAGADTVTQDNTPATVQGNLSCTVADGIFPVSAKQTLEHNTAVVSNVSVADNLVSSLFNAAPASKDGRERAAILIQERFRKAMADITDKLDLRGVAFLHANRTPINNDGTLPSYLTYNATADRFEADASYFQSADFLTDIDATAANNDMMGYFMVSGRRNFYNITTDARYRRQNDNERHLVRFDTTDVSFDIRNLDKTLDTSSEGLGFSFVVGDGTYAMWNYADVTPVPVQIDEDKWRFTINHDRLMIRENGILRPVVLEVLYQRTCVGRDALLNPYFKHNFEIRYLGGLYAAPASGDGHTGILEMVSIPGV